MHKDAFKKFTLLQLILRITGKLKFDRSFNLSNKHDMRQEFSIPIQDLKFLLKQLKVEFTPSSSSSSLIVIGNFILPSCFLLEIHCQSTHSLRENPAKFYII